MVKQGVGCRACFPPRQAWFNGLPERYAWMDAHHWETGHMWAYMQPLNADGTLMRG
jgi:hypothetical protein